MPYTVFRLEQDDPCAAEDDVLSSLDLGGDHGLVNDNTISLKSEKQGGSRTPLGFLSSLLTIARCGCEPDDEATVSPPPPPPAMIKSSEEDGQSQSTKSSGDDEEDMKGEDLEASNNDQIEPVVHNKSEGKRWSCLETLFLDDLCGGTEVKSHEVPPESIDLLPIEKEENQEEDNVVDGTDCCTEEPKGVVYLQYFFKPQPSQTPQTLEAIEINKACLDGSATENNAESTATTTIMLNRSSSTADYFDSIDTCENLVGNTTEAVQDTAKDIALSLVGERTSRVTFESDNRSILTEDTSAGEYLAMYWRRSKSKPESVTNKEHSPGEEKCGADAATATEHDACGDSEAASNDEIITFQTFASGSFHGASSPQLGVANDSEDTTEKEELKLMSTVEHHYGNSSSNRQDFSSSAFEPFKKESSESESFTKAEVQPVKIKSLFVGEFDPENGETSGLASSQHVSDEVPSIPQALLDAKSKAHDCALNSSNQSFSEYAGDSSSVSWMLYPLIFLPLFASQSQITEKGERRSKRN